MAEQIRVLVVDDSTFMRSALVRMVEMDPRFKVVAAAKDGKEGVEKAKELKPDVMTLDVEMPVMNGLEALREIMATVKTPVIMVSTLTDAGAKITLEALELGAVDFIPKALADKDKNIFRGAETLHEKLLAAAGANMQATTPQPAKAGAPLVATPPAAGRVARLPNAKIVVVGSSTGGPKALQQVMRQLPKNFRAPVLVAQHMPAHFTQALAARLNETCEVAVMEASDGMTLEGGKVYIAPGGGHMRVEGAMLRVSEDAGESVYRPSVDVLTESVRKAFGKAAVGVMLTGMGNDGTREFVKLKQDGGYTLAQDQATCVVYGMPRAVAEAGGASEVVSLEQMGVRLTELFR